MTDRQEEWVVSTEYASYSSFKKFRKHYPAEYVSCFTNLNKVKELLDGGNKLKSFQLGFFRSERNGLYRVGQTGVGSAKESRLYVYPDQESRTIYVLAIGTKEQQSQDIKTAKQLIQQIQAEG